MRHPFDCLIQDRAGQVFGDVFVEYVQLKIGKPCANIIKSA
jgi:hypothetical protein